MVTAMHLLLLALEHFQPFSSLRKGDKASFLLFITPSLGAPSSTEPFAKAGTKTHLLQFTQKHRLWGRRCSGSTRAHEITLNGSFQIALDNVQTTESVKIGDNFQTLSNLMIPVYELQFHCGALLALLQRHSANHHPLTTIEPVKNFLEM